MTCIPNENKQKKFLKNWNPKTSLNVVIIQFITNYNQPMVKVLDILSMS